MHGPPKNKHSMEGEGVVCIKVSNGKNGEIVFEGKVSTDILADELVRFGCFFNKSLCAIHKKGSRKRLMDFKRLNNVELVASSVGAFKEFSGVLYIGAEDGVLRKSKTVPSCKCVSMTGWGFSNEACQKAFQHVELEELRIYWRSLNQIPREIGKMTKLTILTLSSMAGLKSVPEEIGLLCQLKELKIAHCDVRGLPSTIGDLKQLEKLNLHHLEMLQSIPEELKNCSNLRRLRIAHGVLDRFPSGLSELPRLKSLILLGVKRIQLFPEDVPLLLKLENLEVSMCRKFFAPPNSLELFRDALRKSETLRSIKLNFEDQDDLWNNHMCEALRENGCIVEAKGNVLIGLEEICKRNKSNCERALQSVLCMLALRNTRRALVDAPKEIVQIIARMLWASRCDVEAWTMAEPRQVNDAKCILH